MTENLSRKQFVQRVLGATLGVAMSGVSPSSATPAPRREILLGAYVPDPYWEPAEWPAALAEYDRAAGRRPFIAQWYVAWGGEQPFPTGAAELVRTRGQVPMITWEPWDWRAGPVQREYALSRTIHGVHDDYIRGWARQTRAYEGVVYLRFAPEMNGNWNPWSESANGNAAGEYVQAWRHVHAIFAEERVANVRWTWTPFVNYNGSTRLSDLYPGDAWVDVVGVDGYNWGPTFAESWLSFSMIFRPTVQDITSLTGRPLWVTEVGCAEKGGDKAAWITDMFDVIGRDPRIGALIWFNANKETDWRIDSSAAALSSFRAGVASCR